MHSHTIICMLAATHFVQQLLVYIIKLAKNVYIDNMIYKVHKADLITGKFTTGLSESLRPTMWLCIS